MNDLDLSSLASGPVALADAASIRARGEQRRQRGRAVVAGAAALVVLAGAGTAVALADRGKPESLQIANPTGTPSAGSPEPTVTQEPPGVTPTVGPELLLQPADGTFVVGGTWRGGHEGESENALLQVCKEADVVGVSGVYRNLDGPGDASARSQVLRFEDGGGVPALNQLEADLKRCPSRPDDSEDGKAYSTHELVPPPAVDVVAVRATYRDCQTCTAHVSYWVAVADISHISYVQVPETEQPRLAKWADAARFRLVCADPTCTRGDDETGAEPGPLADDDRARIDGIGPITVGMTLAEAEAAAGQRFTTMQDDFAPHCGHVAPRSGSPDINLMLIDGKVARFEVDKGSATRTDRGIGIGATEDEVKAAYPGRVVVRPHAYTDGHYLRVVSHDGRLALVLETDGTRVTMFRSGTARAADYTEGCA
ncbi:MAG TPA: hypothetical protein VM097_11940 [Mycobacteriales bacterium]|nr:hypothetical protein [Mycobacteriales bacterium]